LTVFAALSAVFVSYSNWLPRFASNWTHILRCAGEAAQSRCRFCLKACLIVYLMSNTRNRAPIGRPADGAIAFSTGGSLCSARLHATVGPTD